MSPATGAPMRLVRFGTSGPALVYVPSSGGDQREFARYGMHRDAAPWIEAGRLQVVSIDGMAPGHLWNDTLSPPERIRGYARFERSVVEEVLPWVARFTGDSRPAIAGASYGAHVAANLLFKHPRRVSAACGLGGVYGMWHRLDGYHDDDVYFHTPLEYLPRLTDASILSAIRATDGMTVFGAERDEWLWSTERLLGVLAQRRLPHRSEIWPAPADHHERWWKPQLLRFLEWRYGALRSAQPVD